MKEISGLIGVDQRGGKGYQETDCVRCGGSVFISQDSEAGTCARCVQAATGTSGPKSEINIEEIKKAIMDKKLKQYRKDHKLMRANIARALGISENQYRKLEGGPVRRITHGKVGVKQPSL